MGTELPLRGVIGYHPSQITEVREGNLVILWDGPIPSGDVATGTIKLHWSLLRGDLTR